MNASQATLRRAASLRSPATQSLRQWARHSSANPSQASRERAGKLFGYGLVFGGAAAAAYYYPQLKGQFTSEEITEIVPKAEVEFEKPRRAPRTEEENRELLSSQHLQVQKSWEHPGVYVWGSNVGKVTDPNSNEKNVKLPRRLKFFDDQLLRDLKLTENFGAAVTEQGDLVQWGLGFSQTDPTPTTTLKGKNLIKIDVSADRIIGLAQNGTVYSISSSRDDQEGGLKQDNQSGGWGLWSSSAKEYISFRNLTPSGLGYGEKIIDISSGLEHALLLTSKGRVYSAASSGCEFPNKGQMGIPGLTWETRPAGPYDQPHEITALRGFQVEQIATGDWHSVALDKLGRIFTFGDNLYGQLGFEAERSVPFIDAPAPVSISMLYKGTALVPKVTSVAAGGKNTYFTVDADTPPVQENLYKKAVAAPSKRLPQTTSDLWAAGHGVYGALGTGRWTHVSLGPNKVKALSSLFEFNETTNKLMPIKLKSLSIGATHCAAIMDNVTETNTGTRRATENETNWGADVLFWGGNEHYQIGTGKRNNLNTPSYIGPLDGGEGDAEKGRKGEKHRLCLTPRQTARIGEGAKGRKVTLEQKVECGQFVTGVYSAV